MASSSRIVPHYDPTERIDLVEYDPAWADAFRCERDLIADALRRAGIDARVEHVGSTAVPGLIAKPVIDIMLGVKNRGGAERYVPVLEPLGYNHRSHSDDAKRLFFWKGVPRSHHVHVVELEGPTFWKHVLFRDHLLAHPETARQYAELKREAAEKFRFDRSAYSEYKTGFISSVVVQALGSLCPCSKITL